jgi:hypothetical protein
MLYRADPCESSRMVRYQKKKQINLASWLACTNSIRRTISSDKHYRVLNVVYCNYLARLYYYCLCIWFQHSGFYWPICELAEACLHAPQPTSTHLSIITTRSLLSYTYAHDHGDELSLEKAEIHQRTPLWTFDRNILVLVWRTNPRVTDVRDNSAMLCTRWELLQHSE